MKLQKTGVISAVIAAMAISAQAQYSNPATIPGNGNIGFGGPVGNGTLGITDNGSSVTFTLNAGGGSLGGNDLVLYIDSVPGGFTSTAGFNDNGDGGRIAVSGYGGVGQQSVLTFAAGFAPNYAVDIGSTYASLFGLANGGANSLNYITGTAQTASPYSLTVPLADLGLTPGAGQSFEVFGTLDSESGYRSTEAIAGNDAGVQGWNPFIQSSFDTYTTVTTVPEPSTIALGAAGLAALLAMRRRH
jgi:MYXO-CTERM domain-containing protein